MRGQIHLSHDRIALEEKRNEGFLHSGGGIFYKKAVQQQV
jgi:hypothetical protein